jgi:carboxyl-terminal processing protease
MRPGLTAPPLDGITFAVIEADPASNLEPGDQVMSVNDVPMPQVLDAVWPHSVGCSVGGKLRSAGSRMLRGAPGQDVSVGVIRHHGAEKFISMNVHRSESLSEDAISSRNVDEVPVIRISRWSNENGGDLASSFDSLLDKYRNSPGLIIDVRNNGGGQDAIADRVTGRFLKEPVLSSISLHRVVPRTTFESKIITTAPRGPWRYEGRVVVLTDEGCMSACEHFVSGMIEAGAVTCGTPTSGAGGLVRSVQLPGGARLNVSQTIPIHTGGVPSPQLGIAPHLWAPRTLADVIAGEDTALRAALRWIKSNEPVPPRSQPVSPFSN